MDAILHPATKLAVAQFIKRPAHAMLITGPEGSGKEATARQLASQLLQVAELERYPYFRMLKPEGQAISIETIRELLHFTKLKIAGDGVRRVIIIDQAQTMTGEAQNGLLKLLEEPPEGTVFLLTATSAQHVLPTVRSRAQQLAVLQPNPQDLTEYFAAQNFGTIQIKQAVLMSGGLPGLMHALLHDSDEHPLVNAADRARAILKANTFERLAMVDELTKQKADLGRILFMLQQMAHAAMQQGSPSSLKRWHKVLQAAYDASEALASSAQPKLVLTNAMLHL